MLALGEGKIACIFGTEDRYQAAELRNKVCERIDLPARQHRRGMRSAVFPPPLTKTPSTPTSPSSPYGQALSVSHGQEGSWQCSCSDARRRWRRRQSLHACVPALQLRCHEQRREHTGWVAGGGRKAKGRGTFRGAEAAPTASSGPARPPGQEVAADGGRAPRERAACYPPHAAAAASVARTTARAQATAQYAARCPFTTHASSRCVSPPRQPPVPCACRPARRFACGRRPAAPRPAPPRTP